jgi:O-antigen/teichoic acid export membrane protein
MSAPGEPPIVEPGTADPGTGAAEILVEGVPAALSLAPSAPGLALGGELPLNDQGETGVDSMRTGLLQAGPLAAAGVLANGANVIVTIALARLLSPHSYGVLNQLTGLFLILSMPGSAVVVAVVRRVTLWHEDGSGHLVRRWAGRIHRQSSLIVVVWAIAVFAARHLIAQLLGQKSGIGAAAILTAAAVFVLLSLDRGLLQAHRAYRPLASNLLVEGGMRTVAVLILVGAGKGASGAAVGILVAEAATALHARFLAVRAWSHVDTGLGAPLDAPLGASAATPTVTTTSTAAAAATPPTWRTSLSALPTSLRTGWGAALRPDHVLDGAPAARHRVVLDLVIASISLSMVAVLQNVDVLIVGRDNSSHSGAYAAVSVTSKAIVFGAVVLGGYLLPEAAIRWRQGGHALRQLGVVLVLLSIPAALVLVVALEAPHLLLQVVFHHAYTDTATALAPLVGAMILLSVSVILTMYLLAIGRRWVAAVLAAGGVALGVAAALVHGNPHATAVADLIVQAIVLLVIVVGFAVVHALRTGHRAPARLSSRR